MDRMNETSLDVLAPGLAVVFCGINPGARAAAAGHNFVGRGNRFWRVIHQAGFTPKQISSDQDRSLLNYGCGLTAAVARPTRRADELSRDELLLGGQVLRRKIEHYLPHTIAFLGKAAYASIIARRDISWGSQPDIFAGAAVWVLPNPSGLNRGFSLEELITAYRALRLAVDGNLKAAALLTASGSTAESPAAPGAHT
jgi:TDG/mug DNA glycosylase family protein